MPTGGCPLRGSPILARRGPRLRPPYLGDKVLFRFFSGEPGCSRACVGSQGRPSGNVPTFFGPNVSCISGAFRVPFWPKSGNAENLDFPCKRAREVAEFRFLRGGAFLGSARRDCARLSPKNPEPRPQIKKRHSGMARFQFSRAPLWEPQGFPFSCVFAEKLQNLGFAYERPRGLSGAQLLPPPLLGGYRDFSPYPDAGLSFQFSLPAWAPPKAV